MLKNKRGAYRIFAYTPQRYRMRRLWRYTADTYRRQARVSVYGVGKPADGLCFSFLAIHLKDGKTFTILAHNNNRENKYVQKMTLNGKELNTPFFAHQDIVNGGWYSGIDNGQ